MKQGRGAVAHFVISVALVVVFVLPARAQLGTGPVEPTAGGWKTWVLASGSELRLPQPPDEAATRGELDELRMLAAQRDSTMRDRIVFWDAGAPAYRWVEMALERASREPIRSINISRAIALVNVAIYDATIAVWDSKYAYNRRRPSEVDSSLSTALPTPRSPSYPSEHAATAGAASAVLAYLFPSDAQRFTDQAEEAARSRALAGVQYPSDVRAGLTLGRAVAARVIGRAKADGFDASWTGTVPTGPGLWNGTNRLFPLAGIWKPWVLSSANQFRPSPPPAYDSAAKVAELTEIKSFPRTFDTNEKAFFAQTAEGIYGFWYHRASEWLFEDRAMDNALRVARVYALMSVAHADAFIACWDAKYAYWAIRPFQLDPDVKTLFPTPNHPSYPAAHGCASGGIAATMAYLFPSHANFITERATENGMSRLWAGIHYRSRCQLG